MRNDLDTKQLLHGYNVICTHGSKNEQYFLLNGIKAWSDFDGYSVYLSNGPVTLSIYFHGKYHAEYQKNDELEHFLKQLRRIITDNKPDGEN